MFELRIRTVCQQFCFAQRLTNKFLSHSTPVQSKNELITKSSTSWAGMHARREEWFRLLCVVAPAEGNNCKFICLSPPRQARKRKFLFHISLVLICFKNKSWFVTGFIDPVRRWEAQFVLLLVWSEHLSVLCFTMKLNEIFPQFSIFFSVFHKKSMQ